MKSRETCKTKLHWIWVFTMVSLALGLTSPSLKADGIWVRKADMPTPRSWLAAGMVDGIIYAIGGASSYQVDRPTVEAYDPATDTWTKKADMPTARSGLTVGAVNGKIYAIGGWVGNTSLSTVEEYDPKTDTWTRKADMPTRRDTLRNGVVDGIIYVIGGYAGGRSISTVEAYDPATDTWTKKANMPTARWAIGPAPVVDGLIYVMGGETRSATPTQVVEVYDPATDTWTRKSDRPAWTVGIGGLVDGRIYTKAASYNPTTDEWTQEPAMPSTRARFATAVVNEKVYYIGGSVAWNAPGLAIVEEFTPDLLSAVSPQGKLPALWGALKVWR